MAFYGDDDLRVFSHGDGTVQIQVTDQDIDGGAVSMDAETWLELVRRIKSGEYDDLLTRERG